MVKKQLTVLGINPGSKYLGISVFNGPELKDWRIKTIKGKWSKEKMEKFKIIISDYIQKFNLDALAIKKLDPSRSSEKLDKLVFEIKVLSEKKDLRVYQYSIKQQENFFSGKEKINKQVLAEKVASEYPVLVHELSKENSHKNSYHIRMFEAVALGAICSHQLDNY